MSERWVKATGCHPATAITRKDRPNTWINMAKCINIWVDDDGITRITTGDMDDEHYFREPPEHFLPKKDLAVFRMFDALVEIKRGIPQSLAQASADAAAAVEAYKEMGE